MQVALCLLHIKVMEGQSKTIRDFTFITHRGKEVLLIFPCAWEY